MISQNPIVRMFGYVWRFIERLVKAVQVIIFLFVALFVVSIVSGLSGAAVSVPESAALVIAPSGLLVEQAEGEPLDRALMESQDSASGQTIVREVVKSLRYAAKDDRIKVVVLLTEGLQGGGLSKQQVIADAIDEFRASGKRVIAMADSYDQAQYFLAAHADEIYMHDFGIVMIEGFGYFKAYFADAIDKLKVDVNVFRVGEYKSFVEPFLRNDMSAEDREAAKHWLESLWAAYVTDVSAARGLTREQLEDYINNFVPALSAAGGDAAKAAMTANLIDGLMNHQEFRSHMIGIVGESAEVPDDFEGIDYRTYLTALEFENTDDQNAEHKVAVIVASGEIVDGEAAPGTVGSITLSNLIREAAGDETVSAVVLQVDSPGGSMFASEVVLDELNALKATGKPLIASMSSVAASGGYYISLPADEIWASETTISGSIGVGAIFPTFQRTLGALGVTVDGFGTSSLSGQLSQVQALNEESQELIDISVRSAYDIFIDRVAEARGMDRARVDEVARGRVWTGADALEIGLVDKIGGIDEAIQAAADKAGLAAGSWDTKYIERELSFAERLLLQYARLFALLLSVTDTPGQGSASILAQRLFGELDSAAVTLDAWNDPRGLYYHCFCSLR